MTEEYGSPGPGPDRQYWRRRINREVRRARRTRTALRFLRAACLNLAMIGVLVYAAYETFGHVTTTPRFALRRIEVAGTARLAPDDVRKRLAPWTGRNLLDVDLDEAAAAVAADPWVESASLQRVLPGTLRVRVLERTPAALSVIRGIVHVVDAGGFVIGEATPQLLVDRPLLTGLDRLESADLARALALGVSTIARLEAANPGLVAEASEIDLGRPDRVVIVPKRPGPLVLLDPDKIERNVGDYLALRGDIESRFGPQARVDLRWRDRISILPATDPSEPESH